MRTHSPLISFALLLAASAAHAQPADHAAGALPDPGVGATQLLLGPTARTLPAGVLEGSLIPLMGSFGVAERLTLGVGPVLLPMVAFGGFVAPKLQLIRREALEVALGSYSGWAAGGTESPGFGLVYGVATAGVLPGVHLTTGVGSGYLKGELASPVVLVGGEVAAGGSLQMVGEAYLGGRSTVILAGPRWRGSRRALGVGVLALRDDDRSRAYAWFNLSRRRGMPATEEGGG